MQPLSICMSYQGTMNIVEKISQDHDMEVQIWADELVDLIEKPPQEVSVFFPHDYLKIYASFLILTGGDSSPHANWLASFFAVS